MKNRLNYIPSNKQLDDLRQHLYASSSSVQEPQPQSEQPSPRKTLSKSDLDNMITRLSQNTKNKVVRSQIEKIRQANEKQQRKLMIETQGPRVEERLMKQGKQKAVRRDQMQKEREEELEKKMQDRPHISKNHIVIQKPIKDRYKDVLINKEKHMKNLHAQHRPSFVPQINTYSKFIAQIRNENDMNIVNRLKKQGKHLQQKRQRIANKIDQQLNQQNTFKPKINIKTNSLLRHNPLFSNDVPFQKRVEIMNRHNRSRDLSPNQPECTFQPKICSKSSKLVGQHIGSVGDRLYLNAQQIKQKKAKIKQEIDHQYSFQPKINKVKMASDYGQSSQSFFQSDDESLFQQQPKQQIRSCSMRNSDVKPRYLESSRKQVSQMTTDERESQRCTFKPTLFKPIKQPQAPEVYGLENYLKNIDRARRLQLDKVSATEKVRSEKYLHSLF